MTWRAIGRQAAGGVIVAAAIATVLALAFGDSRWLASLRGSLHSLVDPGPLSSAHATVAPDCAQCHQALRPVGVDTCGTCHHHEPALLARHSTAFHADASTCGSCHAEHRGGARMPTRMDHDALLDLAAVHRTKLEQGVAPSVLACASCHERADRHLGRFGADCAACHAMTQWAVAEFRHPSPRSRDCVECHREPPSHTMEHFAMVSQPAARQPQAQVEQCYLCHRTTSWNDIPGVGWYKHH